MTFQSANRRIKEILKEFSKATQAEKEEVTRLLDFIATHFNNEQRFKQYLTSIGFINTN